MTSDAQPAAARQDVILATDDLGLTIGGARIVEGVTLDVRDGEFLAVIGPNGAGKTSLFNLLTGIYEPTRGRVILDGDDITGQPTHVRARRGLKRSFQVTSIFPALTVLENARLAAQAELGGSLDLFRRVTGRDEATARARRALELTGLGGLADTDAASLSHGNKRKLDLALVLAQQPRVLLLDEPTAGMSMEDLPGLIHVVRDIQAAGTTVVMVEHRMDVVIDLADRIAVMHHGTLLACDQPDAVMANETVQSAYLGESL
ncbi:MAG: ABC transporter ATP-binding protein [Actinobacteria bacterium]|nr:ABC transporter ATP-binding protein [Actinomycetota bacterium]